MGLDLAMRQGSKRPHGNISVFQFSILNSQFKIQNSKFKIQNSKFITHHSSLITHHSSLITQRAIAQGLGSTKSQSERLMILDF
jgi:hypothetical protein